MYVVSSNSISLSVCVVALLFVLPRVGVATCLTVQQCARICLPASVYSMCVSDIVATKARNVFLSTRFYFSFDSLFQILE